MRKYLSYILIALSILISTLCWDLIKFPYDNDNLINGNYSLREINPLNDTIRGLFFIFFPISIYILTEIKLNKSKLLFNLNDHLKFDDATILNKNEFNITSLILIIFIFIEFFSLDYQNFVTNLDTHHEGTLLSAPVNFYLKGTLWLGTLYDYGFIGNNISIIFSYIFGDYSIGINRFSKVGIILINKILIILLCRKIILNVNEFRNKSLIFFIFSFTCLSLANFYQDVTPIHQRLFIFLVFFLFLLEILNFKMNKFLSFLTGLFSSISLLFYIDIGSYINAIIFLALLYLVFQKNFTNSIYVLFGVISSWLAVYLIFPNDELNEFVYQYKFIVGVSDYLLGIEFPKPFTDGATRHTKALLMIIFSGVFLFNYVSNKSLKENNYSKIIFLFLFISSIIFFKSGLMRSDGPHIKYTSGLYTLIIFFFIYFYSYRIIKNNKFFIKMESLFFNKKYFFTFILLILSIDLILKNNYNILNTFNSNKNFYALTKVPDDQFLKDDYVEFLNYYKKISQNDNCVQQLTDDNALPYLLNKPSCTQFYNNAHIIIGWTEKKFINQLKSNEPEFIIYSSEINWFKNLKNSPNVEAFIMKNYRLFEEYKSWKIYKKL